LPPAFSISTHEKERYHDFSHGLATALIAGCRNTHSGCSKIPQLYSSRLSDYLRTNRIDTVEHVRHGVEQSWHLLLQDGRNGLPGKTASMPGSPFNHQQKESTEVSLPSSQQLPQKPPGKRTKINRMHFCVILAGINRLP